MKKVFDQTMRDFKREVNKKVLKVPGIEQKVLDATSNEPWGPHGTLLADISLATKNYHEYQMIMAVIWKRINDTGKNWRHVYKGLTVLEYLVAHGSERVIDEIKEHSHQISTLSNFQYMDSSGRDQGSNVRKKSQSLVYLVNDKERISEIRLKASVNRDKFRNTSASGMHRHNSYSNTVGYGDRYDDDHQGGCYGYTDEDRSTSDCRREGVYGCKDEDPNGRYSDSFNDGDHYGRASEEHYRGEGLKEDDQRGRKSLDDFDSRSKSSDRERDHPFDDDGRSSSRGSCSRVDDQSLDGRLERKFSEQNITVLPSYEEAVNDSRSISPGQGERNDENSAAPASPKALQSNLAFSPPATNPTFFDAFQNPNQHTVPLSTFLPTLPPTDAVDEFDPRNLVFGAPNGLEIVTAGSNSEIDVLGDLSDPVALNPFSILPVTLEGNPLENFQMGAASPSEAVSAVPIECFENPFEDSPFKAHQSGDVLPLAHETFFTSEQEPDVLSGLLPPSTLFAAPPPEQFSAPTSQSAPALSFSSMHSEIGSVMLVASNTSPSSQSAPSLLANVMPSQFGSVLAVASNASASIHPSPHLPINDVHSQFRPFMPVSSNTSPISQPAPLPVNEVQSKFVSVLPVAANASLCEMPVASGSFLFDGGSKAVVPAGPTTAQFSGGNLVDDQGYAAQVSEIAQSILLPSSCSSRTFLPLPSYAVSSSAQVPSQFPSGAAIIQNNALSATKPSTKEKFETRSSVWADTLSKGLVNLNISGPKINPLSDIGVDFDALNRKEKRTEKPAMTSITSTTAMGKAMGSGSGIGRSCATALRPPDPTRIASMGVSSGMNVGINRAMPPSISMADNGGINPQIGMGAGMTIGQVGYNHYQPNGLPPRSSTPSGYNPVAGGNVMGGIGCHSQPHSYGGGC